MFRWIIGSSLQFRFLVLAVAAAPSVRHGQLKKMPVDVFPEFAPPSRTGSDGSHRAFRQRGRGPDHPQLSKSC